MKDPKRTASIASAMAGSLPVSIKCRLGVDVFDMNKLVEFVRINSEEGKVNHFIIHSRVGILNKPLSPKQNYSIPQINYEPVVALKKQFPHLTFTVNGEIRTLKQVEHFHKQGINVMMGRHALEFPFFFKDVDKHVFGKEGPRISRRQLVEEYAVMVEEEIKENLSSQKRSERIILPVFCMVEPLFHLFNDSPHRKNFNEKLRESLHTKKAHEIRIRDVFSNALKEIPAEHLDTK